MFEKRVLQVVPVVLTACLLCAGLAAAEQTVEGQNPQVNAASERAPAKLEFWPQSFVRGNVLEVTARILAVPLLRDEQLKQFKTLYFEKLAEGMDVAAVDAKMEEAFSYYDETQDREQLMERLRAVEELLNAYTPPPYMEEQFVYVAMGASITQGGGASPASNGWTYLVADRLREIHPGAHVRNLAVGGTTTQQARDVQLPEALECRPDLVTCTAGINDLQYGVPADTVRDNMDAILRGLTEKTNARIVMTLMPPGLRFPAFSLGIPKLDERKKNLTPERVAEFNAIFRELAATYDARLVDIGELVSESLEQDEMDTLFSFDGIHPSNAGHVKTADIFWKTIREAVASGEADQ